MKAIETRYAGCRFRSRLEARWAVFFDTLGIEWEYEPQGFEVPVYEFPHAMPKRTDQIVRYLPDFWLPKQQIWFEVKGKKPDSDDPWFHFAAELSFCACQPCDTYCWCVKTTPGRAVIAFGDIPDPCQLEETGPPTRNQSDGNSNHDMWVATDYDYAWTQCHICGSFDIQFDARGARNYCGCHDEPDSCGYWFTPIDNNNVFTGPGTQVWAGSDKCYLGNSAQITLAYEAARSARFEHGEQG